MPSLFIVKVPASTPTLNEKTYKALMVERVAWMIQQWITSTNSTPQATQRLLATMLGQLHPSQDFPLLEEDKNAESPNLTAWKEAWGETLTLYNHAFSQALHLSGISFPITVMTEAHPEFQDARQLHQETYLEEWLTDLTSYA
jgi:hypothetical protein